MRTLWEHRRKLIVITAAVALLAATAGLWWAIEHSELAMGRKLAVIPSAAQDARLLTNDQGDLIYRVTWRDGRGEDLTPSRFAQLLEADHRSRPIYMRILNVSSTAGLFWIVVGLLAQAVFMARMLVQWMASEKQNRSVVPPLFWWLSLIGASMLIVYFIWRRDVIGVLGQSTGWVVYIRNIILIRRESLGTRELASNQ